MRIPAAALAALLIAIYPACTSAQNAAHLLTPEATRNTLQFLSSDEMKGRAVFSPEIDKAAGMIAASFKKSGLQPLQGNSFLQPFSVYSAAFKGLSATIDEKEFPKNNIIVITGQPELAITEATGYRVERIKNGDNLFRAASGFVHNNQNTIVLVDESFSENFKRLIAFKRNFFKRDYSTLFILGNPEMKTYSITASHTIKEQPLANVAGILPGKSKKEEYVIFSAHYDHLGIGQPENGDSIYNGANDDASGTTAVILLAEYFGKLNNNERSIIFTTFTAEESGGFGSQYFSQQLDPAKIVAMLNIEMIGTDSKWGKNSAYITGFEKSDLGTILQKNLKGTGFEFYPDPYPDQQLFYRSDNATLARLGVPAHTISTSKMDNEPHYHKPSDEIKTLDLDNMTQIIKSIGLSATSIISGTDTPSRVTEK